MFNLTLRDVITSGSTLMRAFIRKLRYRLPVAIRYAFGRLTVEDAQRISHEMPDITGWYPALCICVEDVMEDARERWANAEEMKEFVWSGAYKAADYYEPYDYGEIREQALRLAVEYAEANGVKPIDKPEWDL